MYYFIAVREGWYNGKENTPFESAFYADFEDFVSRVAIKNVLL